MGAERLRTLQGVAEAWYRLGHRGFFWPARKTSAGHTAFGVPNRSVMHKVALPSMAFCLEPFVFPHLGALA